MKILRQTFTIILINLAVISIILYGFEFFFDPYDKLPQNGFINGKLYTWGHPVKVNRFGFREKAFSTPKPNNLYRVMVLGDSLTYGAGLRPEERYTKIAEKILNRQFTRFPIEVLNFGVSGGPTLLEAELLKRLKSIVQPDLVVVGFCLNDPQPRSQEYSIEKELLDNKFVTRIVQNISLILKFFKLNYIGTLVKDTYYKTAQGLGLIPAWQEALDRVYNPSSDEWQKFIQALKKIKTISDSLDLAPPVFIVLNQGTYTDRPTDYAHPDPYLKQYLRWYHQAEQAAQEQGFQTYNHETAIAQQLNNEPLSINILDGHPSAHLNRIYGEALARQILKIVSQ